MTEKEEILAVYEHRILIPTFCLSHGQSNRTGSQIENEAACIGFARIVKSHAAPLL